MEIKEIEMSFEKAGWQDFISWQHHLSSQFSGPRKLMLSAQLETVLM